MLTTQLLEGAVPQTSVSLSRKPGGRLTSVTDAEGNTTSFEYDAQNNVIKVVDPENGEDAPTAYGHDQKGNRTDTLYPRTDLVSTRNYDDADPLESLINENAGGAISSFAYEMDAVGNRTQVVDNVGGMEATTALARRGSSRTGAPAWRRM